MKLITIILITLFTQSIMAQKIDNPSSEELKEKANMKSIREEDTGDFEINIRVISLSMITRFTGEAIAVDVDAKYVVSALILESKSIYKDRESAVGFPVHCVSFFAIHSPAKLFYESDIVGKEYSIKLKIEIVNGKKSYGLTVL